jgi:hypothetical protein
LVPLSRYRKPSAVSSCLPPRMHMQQAQQARRHGAAAAESNTERSRCAVHYAYRLLVKCSKRRHAARHRAVLCATRLLVSCCSCDDSPGRPQPQQLRASPAALPADQSG